MPDDLSPRDVDFALILGEMRGQLKELVHSMVNKQQHDEAVGRAIAELSRVPDDIKDIKKELTALKDRMSDLEETKNKFEGGRGVILTVFQSPSVAWCVLGIGFIVAYFKGLIFHG